jgi:uridine monophosphate synthetase
LVDDLVTTGLSLKKSALAVRAEGGLVSDAFVLLDREEGGRERLESAGIKLHSVLRIRDVAQKLYEMNAIGEDEMKMIMSQVKKMLRET